MTLKKCPCCSKIQTTKNAEKLARNEFGIWFNCRKCRSTFLVVAKRAAAAIVAVFTLSACEGGGGSNSLTGENLAPIGAETTYRATDGSNVWIRVVDSGSFRMMFDSCEVQFSAWSQQDLEPSASRLLLDGRGDNCALQFDQALGRSVINYVPNFGGDSRCIRVGVGLSGQAVNMCKD